MGKPETPVNMAAPTLPPEFVDLATAYKTSPGTFVNVIGYVVDCLPSSIVPRTGQHQMLFKLQDRKLLDSSLNVMALDVKFFVHAEDQLPQIKGTGDIVLLRSIKINGWGNRPSLLCNKDTVAIVFPANIIPEPQWKLRYQQGTEQLTHHATSHHISSKRVPSVKEQNYAIDLFNAIKDTDLARFATFPPTAHRPPTGAPRAPAEVSLPKRFRADVSEQPAAKRSRLSSTFGPKYRTISDLEDFKFADLCVEIVDKYFSVLGGCEIKVTDYTENKQLYYFQDPEESTSEDAGRDGDEFGYSKSQKEHRFRGPFGQLVLTVDLKEPHAGYVDRNVNVGDIVLLKNVKIKVWGSNPVMGGGIWPDHLYPDKPLVERLRRSDRPEIDALHERKQKYWEARSKTVAPPQAPKGPKKKKPRSGKRASQKHEAAKMQEALDAMSVDSATSNKHMRCSHSDQPLCSIGKVLKLESQDDAEDGPILYQNHKYRALVRVADFFPNIEEFAVRVDARDPGKQSQYYADLLHEELTQSAMDSYKWRFSLLLEDASAIDNKEQVWVSVSHEDAQFLLGNDVGDPANLSESPQLLAKLKQQLCVLWGDLEELKSKGKNNEPPSNRPFECCIAEYGIPADEQEDGDGYGVVRMFKMFGTAIL